MSTATLEMDSNTKGCFDAHLAPCERGTDALSNEASEDSEPRSLVMAIGVTGGVHHLVRANYFVLVEQHRLRRVRSTWGSSSTDGT